MNGSPANSDGSSEMPWFARRSPKRRADARALEMAEEPAVVVDAHAVVEEVEVLEDDRRRPPCPSPR